MVHGRPVSMAALIQTLAQSCLNVYGNLSTSMTIYLDAVHESFGTANDDSPCWYCSVDG
ncbi:hypothetical protein JI435_410910 [Parastagonospora nodorum SN15]|uniref:Uncharacterized protein n=1 Tax=Phaeosphaeria nodorum (strain SN15 / ATCC MYA-4574 / FGSC 10173) TaxID=321614 RepID=A0A7U2F3D1_PHANO|nr:hypothetical protein JI435_410910 [Parastagonospora nodorum SN15]